MFDTLEIGDSSSFQDLFDSVLGGLGAGVVIFDREFKIIYSNRRCASQSGKSMDEVIGGYCYEISHQIDKPCSDEGRACPAQMTFKTGQPERAIHNRFNVLGNEIFIEVSTYPIKDKNGRVAHVIETTRDISEERKWENDLGWTKEFLYNIIQNSGDAIITFDLDFKITSWNMAAEKIFGWNERELLGKTPAIFKDQASETVVALEKVKKGEPVSDFEAVRKRKDSSLVTVSTTYSPILGTEGNVVGISSISRDITERKQMEDALRKAYEELKELDMRRSDFVNMAAHELRTPLTPIVGYLGLLKNMVESEKALGYIEIMERNAMRQRMLIDRMLELSRLDAGEVGLVYSDVDVNGLLRLLLEDYALAKRKFIVDIPMNFVIKADEGKLFQILDNLISNAVKYSENDTQVKIVVRESEEDYLFQVIDQGVGIEEEDQKRVFERFYIVNGDKLSRSVHRLGLGLTLAKSYVELHGGKIWVESEVGEGSTFYFTIPKKLK